MTAATPKLAALSAADRASLEAYVVEFDRTWTETSFAACAATLPAPGTAWRLPALEEMVKIDLERLWQRRRPARLEDYLSAYPELGTVDTVPLDLVTAECEARRLAGAPVDLAEITTRFPQHADQLRTLLTVRRGAGGGGDTLSTGGFDQSTPSLAQLVVRPAELHERFGRYKIVRTLGGGGMGTVYLAYDTQLERQVALKVPHFAPSDGPEVVERFYREARAAAALAHANICPVFDVGAIDSVHYLTMGYIEGQPLSELVSPDRPLPEREAATIVARLAAALQVAHARGIIHRDLKPSNVMLNADGDPVIMDFGLARRVGTQDAQLTRSGSLIGTPAYMSPEQVRGEAQGVGPQCDIYALGVILYELLAGCRPYQGGLTAVLAKILTEEPAPLAKHRPEVDPRLAEICRRAMAKQPAERYGSMRELSAALESYLRSEADPAAKPQTQTSGGSRGRRPRALVAAAAAGGMLALLWAIWVIVKDDKGREVARFPLPAGGTVEMKAEAEPAGGATGGLPASAPAGASSLEAQASSLLPAAAIAPFDAQQARAHQEAWAKYLGLPVEQTNSVGMKLMLIPPGEFMMGSTEEEIAAALIAAEKAKVDPSTRSRIQQAARPRHRVVITHPFSLGATEVTIGQFKQFVEATKYVTEAEQYGFGDSPGKNLAKAADDQKGKQWRAPGYTVSDELPITQVTWNDAVAFCNWLSERQGLQTCHRRDGDTWFVAPANGYRLPTEAEWEYACRAGTAARYSFGNDDRELEQHAWFQANSGGRPRAVALKLPNAFGLFDMHGNAWEWCQDYYDEAWYGKSAASDPQGPSGGADRVFRGGSWRDALPYTASYRHGKPPATRYMNHGFRIARTLDLSPTRTTPGGNVAMTTAPAESPRAVAEWVIGHGGWVEIETTDAAGKVSTSQVRAANELPAGDLRVSGVRFSGDGKELGLSLQPLVGLEHLKNLAVYSAFRLTDSDLPLLATFRELEEFRSWSTTLPSGTLSTLEQLPKLKTLTLCIGITEKEMPQLLALNGLERLQMLYTDLALADYERLLQAMPKLVALEVSARRLDDRVVALLAKYPRITTVALPHCRFTPEGFRSLSRLNHLHFLQLIDTPCTDADLESLAQLEHVTTLYVQETRVTDDGLRRLLAVKKNLSRCYLAHTVVSDAGLELLAGSKQLLTLDVQDTKVTAAGVAKLQKALPKCKIIWDGAPNTNDADAPAAAGIASAPVSNAPAKSPREVAEWVLANGGWVAISHTDQKGKLAQRTVHAAVELPPGEFDITRIFFRPGDRDTGVSLQQFAGLARLTELVLHGAVLVTDADMPLLLNFPELQSLNINSRDLSQPSLAVLKQLPKLKSLTIASLRVSAEGLPHLLALRQLEGLALTDSDFELADYERLLQALPNLNALRVDARRLDDRVVALLAKSPHVTDVALYRCPLTPAGFRSLGQLRHLRTLIVIGTPCADADLESLAHLENLTALWADRTRITDEGLAHLPALQQCVQLNLSATKITDAGMKHLRGMKQLWDLLVAKTGVTDAGLEHLAAIQSLRNLGLSGTKVTAAGIAKLQAALPKCQIDWDGANAAAAAAGPPAATDSSSAPAANPPAKSPREVAEWVLAKGGTISVSYADPNGKAAQRTVHAAAELPTGEFDIFNIVFRNDTKDTGGKLQQFTGLVNLTDLILHGAVHVAEQDMPLLEKFIKLQRLDIQNANVSQSSLAVLEQLPHLKVLIMSLRITEEGLPHLLKLRELETLQLFHCDFDLAQCERLLEALPNLKALQFDASRLDDRVVGLLAKYPRVTSVALHHCALTPAGFRSLGELQHLRSVHVLYTQCSDDDLRSLAHLQNLTNLGTDSTRVTDVGLIHLPTLSKCTQVSVSNNKISDAGLVHLARMTQLQRLYLQNTKVTDTGLEHLAGLKSLAVVRLQGTKVTAAGVAKLQAALPKCQIEWDADGQKVPADSELSR